MMKNYLVTGTILGILFSSPLQAQKLTLKERMETIRSARIIFYEFDDQYRDVKRNFSRKKTEKEILEIRKKLGKSHDRLRNLLAKNNNVDIPNYCRYISGKLAALISFSFGDYGAYADETEEFKKDHVRTMDEAFLVDKSRCLTLFDEIEAKILAEMKKP